MNRQMNLYYHFFEKKNQLISTSCLFLWKNSLSLQWTTEWILVAFSKKKETSLYKLASFERGQLIFGGVKNPKVKKNKWKWVNQIQKLSVYPRAQEQSVTFKVKLIKAAPEIEFDDMMTHVHYKLP